MITFIVFERPHSSAQFHLVNTYCSAFCFPMLTTTTLGSHLHQNPSGWQRHKLGTTVLGQWQGAGAGGSLPYRRDGACQQIAAVGIKRTKSTLEGQPQVQVPNHHVGYCYRKYLSTDQFIRKHRRNSRS